MFGSTFAAALLLTACGAEADSSIAAEALPAGRGNPDAVAASPAVRSSELPQLTGRVVDQADLLSPAEENRLADLSARLEARTTDQFVVVTVPTLGGHPIEGFGVALGQHWGIGQKDKDNGVLLIVAPNERLVRIEVGYGLEPILTNERAAEIIREDILPDFRQGQLPAGITAGSEAIIGTLLDQADAPRVGV